MTTYQKYWDAEIESLLGDLNAPDSFGLEIGPCREEGIRTPETFPFTRFPSVRLKPLGHLSIWRAKVAIFFDKE